MPRKDNRVVEGMVVVRAIKDVPAAGGCKHRSESIAATEAATAKGAASVGGRSIIAVVIDMAIPAQALIICPPMTLFGRLN